MQRPVLLVMVNLDLGGGGGRGGDLVNEGEGIDGEILAVDVVPDIGCAPLPE